MSLQSLPSISHPSTCLSRAGGNPQGVPGQARQTVIADLIRNPEGQCHGTPVMLASRQYPQGVDGRTPQTVIADLIRNPEGQCHGAPVILASRQYPQRDTLMKHGIPAHDISSLSTQTTSDPPPLITDN